MPNEPASGLPLLPPEDDNPTADELKQHRERELFRLLVECAKLEVPEASIRSRPPPEPDILCLLAGSPCAFELGELSDPAFREGTEIAIKSQRILDNAAWNPPPDVARGLQRKYGQHHVNVAFHESASLMERPAAAADLFAWLAGQEPPVGVLTGKALPPAIRQVIRSVEVRPGAGFLMAHLLYGTSVAPPDLRVLEKKLRTAYNTPHPVELLLHAERSLTPCEVWVEAYGQCIRDKIDGSQFRRVWVFNPAERAGERYEVWFQHANSMWRS